MKKQYFDFKDINLIPKKGIVDTRSYCSTSIRLGKNFFLLPVFPSNMESVIDVESCKTLAANNYFYTMHRFYDDQIEFMKYFKSMNLITSISVGVNGKDYELIEDLIQLDLIPDYITIDVAHGHSEKVEKFLKYIKRRPEMTSFIIAGNISTKEGALDLWRWGADAIRIGQGNGSVCRTYFETGMGTNGIQASIIKEIADFIHENNIPLKIISDGGISERGEIAVALVMGADMVVSGSLFTALSDGPGEMIEYVDGKYYKQYWGSASQYQSGKRDRIEGTKTLIPFKSKTFLEELRTIQESLQSAISYAGGRDLDIFDTTEYIIK